VLQADLLLKERPPANMRQSESSHG